MYGLIYKIINKINGKIYVGKTNDFNRRMAEHKRANLYVDKAIRKHGWENFIVEVLEECETPEQLNEREIFWIAELNSKSPNGYNLTDGGDGGKTCSGENSPCFGRHHTAETRARMSLSHMGKKNSEEARDKISKRQLGNKNALGHRHTAESRAKMAAANKGIPKTLEQCMKVSISKRGNSPFKNLLNAINGRQLTYRKLAESMGLAHQSISRKMSCKRKFTETEWKKLSEILSLPVEYLMKRDD